MCRPIIYRVFHLKRNPNYYTWPLSHTKRRNQWQYWILAAVSRCCSWCTAWYRYGRNFNSRVARYALVTENTSCVPKQCHQSVYSCLIRYFLVRIHIAKCFTNSSKRLRGWTHILLYSHMQYCEMEILTCWVLETALPQDWTETVFFFL
jgi:hypothetical protein